MANGSAAFKQFGLFSFVGKLRKKASGWKKNAVG